MKNLARAALTFTAIGLAIYACVYFAAERLVQRTAHANPIHKIEVAGDGEFDWVILGASHAMPLDFADFNARLGKETGLRIINLAALGTGPLYQRFVFEEFLRRHGARNVLYAADSFAFYSRLWNEDRFADAKLVRRTPFDPDVARSMWGYSRTEGVDPRAVLDYASGFSKINNRERFERDVWEGEAQFERVYRASSTATAKRIEYLYPGPPSPKDLQRYLDELGHLIDTARAAGMNVVVIKMPVPPAYLSRLPSEDAFDAALARMLAPRGIALRDFSASIPEERFYFDTDHLNRAGVSRFVERDLKAILSPRSPAVHGRP
ncbi:MAG TPA: hypothetical protein VLV56_17165 [Burkholderiales bacterium]|nr:hypothetical protein [Burkholderiales bacterium]HUP09021.1 hypothetical protein [Caldimonas sp.]